MRRLPRFRPRALATTLVMALAATSVSACTEVEEKESSGYEPSKLEEVAGKDVKKVTFTAEGAQRVGLRRAAIRADGGREVVPYESIVYDPEGKTYVYVATTPLSFQREPVQVDRVEEGRVIVSDGPPPGTQVVTTGAAEVYGTEQEIAG